MRNDAATHGQALSAGPLGYVLRLIALGHTNAEIGEQLHLSYARSSSDP